ncbi:hypothetical protein BY996DRAFT_7041574, partial [Phakopsora pachyrhizi]
MDHPEDVLDFGEDDDGVDVISLGGSDHDGEPVELGNAELILASSSRNGRSARSPARKTEAKIPSSKCSEGTQRRRQESGRGYERRLDVNDDRSLGNFLAEKPASKTYASSRMPQPEAGNRSSGPSPRNSDRADRPRSGERASYIPSDRLQETEATSRRAERAKADPRKSTMASSSQLPNISDDSSSNTRSHVPVSSSNVRRNSAYAQKAETQKSSAAVDKHSQKLPKGWLSRISSTGKTYYVNAVTRTSQWALPTEPASLALPQANSKVGCALLRNHELWGYYLIYDGSAPSTRQTSSVNAISSEKVESNSRASATEFKKPTSSASQLQDTEVCRQTPIKAQNLAASPSAESSPSILLKKADKQDSAENSRLTVMSLEKEARLISEDQSKPEMSEKRPRSHRIHPDRLQDVAQANSDQRARPRDVDESKALPGSFHRDPPSHQTDRTFEGSRRDESIRYSRKPSPRPARPHQRLKSTSPVPRRARSPPRPSERERRVKDYYPSGANGIPTGSGRDHAGNRGYKIPVELPPPPPPPTRRRPPSSPEQPVEPSSTRPVQEMDKPSNQGVSKSREIIHPSRRDAIDGYRPEGPYSNQPLLRQKAQGRHRSPTQHPHRRMSSSGYMERKIADETELRGRKRPPNGPNRISLDEREFRESDKTRSATTSRENDNTRSVAASRCDTYRPQSTRVDSSFPSPSEARHRGALPSPSHHLDQSHLIANDSFQSAKSLPDSTAEISIRHKANRNTDSHRERARSPNDLSISLSATCHSPPLAVIEHSSTEGREQVETEKASVGRNGDSFQDDLPLALGSTEPAERASNGRKRSAGSFEKPEISRKRHLKCPDGPVTDRRESTCDQKLLEQAELSLALRLGPVVCDEDSIKSSTSPLPGEKSAVDVEIVTIDDSSSAKPQAIGHLDFSRKDVLHNHEILEKSEHLGKDEPTVIIEPLEDIDGEELPTSLSKSFDGTSISLCGLASRQARNSSGSINQKSDTMSNPTRVEEKTLLTVEASIKPSGNTSLRDRIQDLNLPVKNEAHHKNLATRVRSPPKAS